MRLSLSQRLQRHCTEFWAYRICALFWRCIPLALAHLDRDGLPTGGMVLGIHIVQFELVIDLNIILHHHKFENTT
jgi:hypothetical protein